MEESESGKKGNKYHDQKASALARSHATYCRLEILDHEHREPTLKLTSFAKPGRRPNRIGGCESAHQPSG
jgi:hypothetical protein